MNEKEVIEKFKDAKLKFDYYYKYSFNYKVEIDGCVITASFGGGGDEIYRTKVHNNEEQFLGDVFDHNWNSVAVIKNKEIIFHWCEY